MHVHLYDYRWPDEDSINFEASRDSRFGKKNLKIGDQLSLAVGDGPNCAGSSRDGKWQPCPDQVQGRAKCDYCRNREGSFIYTSFDGFDTTHFSDEDLAKIDGEHWVYIALFDENVQKIGVSKANRKSLRQIEQGSTATLYIAKTPNGTVARQIETCFRKSGLMDKVQSQAKKDNWTGLLGENEAQKIMLDLFEKHKNCLNEHPHLNEFLLDPPEFKAWARTFGTDKLSETTQIHEVKLTTDEALSGKIEALKGAYLLINTGAEWVSFCAKDLKGYQVDFTPTAPGLRTNTALQSALF